MKNSENGGRNIVNRRGKRAYVVRGLTSVAGAMSGRCYHTELVQPHIGLTNYAENHITISLGGF